MTKNVDHTFLNMLVCPRDETTLQRHSNNKNHQLQLNMWDHFSRMEDKFQYYRVLIKYKIETNGMKTRLGRCTTYDNSKTQVTQPNTRIKPLQKRKVFIF